MMKQRYLQWLLAVLSVGVGVVNADQAQSESVGLAALDRLLSGDGGTGCWQGRFGAVQHGTQNETRNGDTSTEDEAMAQGALDKHCWRRELQGRYIVDSHEVLSQSGVYAGHTYYRWNPDSEMLEYWYFNSSGGVSEGEASIVAQGLDFPLERYRDQTGSQTGTLEFRSRLRWLGNDRYQVISEERKADDWQEVMNVVYQRLDEDE